MFTSVPGPNKPDGDTNNLPDFPLDAWCRTWPDESIIIYQDSEIPFFSTC